MARRKSRSKKRILIWALILIAAALLPSGIRMLRQRNAPEPDELLQSVLRAEELPAYDGKLCIELNRGIPTLPTFPSDEPFVLLSELDYLGRTGPALGLIGPEQLPTQPRGEIGGVRPAGWQTTRYDDLIEDHFLFNRCHVIAYQLSGINDDPRDLFTGTRALNVEGMLPWENMVSSYIRRTGGQVLYRVSPVYQGSELVPRGVEMEASSLADGGDSLQFHVFVYNVQPGVVIDYRDGGSRRERSGENGAA